MKKTKISANASAKAKSRKSKGNKNNQNATQMSDPTSYDHEVPLELQQLLLNILQNALPIPDDRPLGEVVQEVKGHLYNRDFSAAFGKDEYLRAYAIRWSSSRALGYLRLLNSIFKDYISQMSDAEDGNDPAKAVRVTCIGGGAGAEIISLAGLVRLWSRKDSMNSIERSDSKPESEETRSDTSVRVQGTFVDIADWQDVIQRLHLGTTTPPPISAYASAASKASNTPLLPSGSLNADFKQCDILALSKDDLRTMVENENLITIFFTLNELYTTSMPSTQAFLLNLTHAISPGTLLLVVDSAGSYSTVSLNGKDKKYPMQWLLDHALLNSVSSDGNGTHKSHVEPRWEKLKETESEWFRIPEGLGYPLDLENMRYQLHLYRRL